MLSGAFVAVLSSIGTLSVDNNQNSIGHRVIVLTICIFGGLVYWSYCAVLVSYLTVIDNNLPINNLEDILVKKGYSIILRNGSITNDYFSEAEIDTQPVAHNLFHQGMRRNWYNLT
jgi:hypothetical protein